MIACLVAYAVVKDCTEYYLVVAKDIEAAKELLVKEAGLDKNKMWGPCGWVKASKPNYVYATSEIR